MPILRNARMRTQMHTQMHSFPPKAALMPSFHLWRLGQSGKRRVHRSARVRKISTILGMTG